jgi:hypothetical protein
MRHYLLMACRVGGPNLVANSAGFEIYKSVLRKSTVLYPPASHTVRLESITLLTLRALLIARGGGRNGNDDWSRSSREFRTAITSFGTLTAAVSQSGTPADPRPQGRLRGAQTGQKRAKTRVKEIDLPKKASASARAAQRSCLRLTHGGCN